MITLNSLSYLKLGIGLVLIVFSIAFQNLFGLILTLSGAVFLTTAFASFGNYDYRGYQGKLFYQVIRYIVSSAIILIGIICSYLIIYNNRFFLYYSLYNIRDYYCVAFTGLILIYTIFSTLAAYLIMYKPSKTTIKKKLLKTGGYFCLILGISVLLLYHGSVYSKESAVAPLLISILFIGLGLTLTIIGRRKPTSPKVEISDPNNI